MYICTHAFMHINSVSIYKRKSWFLTNAFNSNLTPRFSLTFSLFIYLTLFSNSEKHDPVALKYLLTSLPPNSQTPSSSCLGSETCVRSPPCTDAPLTHPGFRHSHPALLSCTDVLLTSQSTNSTLDHQRFPPCSAPSTKFWSELFRKERERGKSLTKHQIQKPD